MAAVLGYVAIVDRINNVKRFVSTLRLASTFDTSYAALLVYLGTYLPIQKIAQRITSASR